MKILFHQKQVFLIEEKHQKNILIAFIRNYEKKILCIDHEGGFGGSSRSLFYLIQNIIQIDSNINFEVWCKKRGPIQEMYKSIGVKCIVKNDIRIYSTLYRLSRNFYGFFQAFFP